MRLYFTAPALAPASGVASQLSLEAAQEFQVLSSNFSAEYGRASGGVVNTITRSGANGLHGTAYWFFRNGTLDARDRYASINSVRVRNGKLSWVGIANASMVTEFRFGWFTDWQADTFDQRLLPPGIGLTTLTVQSQTGLGAGASYLPRVQPNEQRFQFADNASWTPGKHWQTYAQTFGNPVSDASIHDYGFYAQGQFLITPRLTLNYGLRYEHAALPQPKIVNSDYPQTGHIHSSPLNMAPRLGIVYSLGDGRTDLATSPVYPAALTAVPANAKGSSTIQFADPNLRTPYTEQGTLAIERQLTSDMAIIASYIWSRGVQDDSSGHAVGTHGLQAAVSYTWATPPIYRVDARLSKILPIGERYKLSLNFEVFNVTNTILDTAIFSEAFIETGRILTLESCGGGRSPAGFPDGANARRAQVGARFVL